MKEVNWKSIADEHSFTRNEMAEVIFKMAAYLAEDMISANPTVFTENKAVFEFAVNGNLVQCDFSINVTDIDNVPTEFLVSFQ